MAISEDTLALVAAQLVTAWTLKNGVQPDTTSTPNTLAQVAMFNTVYKQLKVSAAGK